MINPIDASLTTQSLTFRGNPATFGVIAINRSDRFAAFELEILAAAGNRESNWWRLSPEVSAAKPPGDRTEFQVEILASPITHFVGDINITVKISSPQLATERRLVLRLTIEPAEEASLLSVSLPTQRLQVYPHNTIDIPVEVQNLGLRSAEVALYLKDLDLTWLIGTAERRLQLQARQRTEVFFECSLPAADQALSQDYPFTIVARNREGAEASATGVLKVLAVGFVQFEVQPSKQRLPAKSSHPPDWLSNIAVFQLQFNNASNLLQQVAIKMQGKDCQSCQIKVAPETADLALGKEASVRLSVQVKRPWIGRVKNLQLEAKALLSDRRLGSTEPATQLLMLKVLPLVPSWLLLVLLALLSALLAVILHSQSASISHLATVNAVRLSNTSGVFPLVFSGADDCTIRTWTSAPSGIFPKPETLSPNGTLTEGSLNTDCKDSKPQSLKSPKGLLAVLGQAVRALELIPEKNALIFAGLENGEIEAWDVSRRLKLYSLKDGDDKTDDKVLSLVFAQNSHYLYSAYGSGTVRRWLIPPSGGQSSTNLEQLKFPGSKQLQVWAIVLSPDQKVLISAGSYKSLIHWDLTLEKPIPTKILLSSEFGSQGGSDHFWSAAFAPTSQLLATGDSDGWITLWNLQKCQMKSNHPENSRFQLSQMNCPDYDRWLASPKKAIRSLGFTPDARQLVSAGDDGRIVAWTIEEDKKHAPSKQQVVATLSHRITSIDLTPVNHRILVASGSEDSKVRLHLLEQR